MVISNYVILWQIENKLGFCGLKNPFSLNKLLNAMIYNQKGIKSLKILSKILGRFFFVMKKVK